jgi:hypothetical protein
MPLDERHIRMTRLFDDVVRKDTSWSKYMESTFDFLNRTVRPNFERVREAVEGWFQRFPNDEKAELRARIRSDGCNSALFELMLHELLLRLQCCPEIHPTVPNAEKRPDYLIVQPDRSRFYLEAASVSGVSKTHEGEENRWRQVLDGLERLCVPDYYLVVDLITTSLRPLSTRKVNSRIMEWVNSLDYGEVCRLAEQSLFRRLPSLLIAEDGWEFNLKVLPCAAKDRRDLESQSVGMILTPFEFSQNDRAIHKVIQKKATRYGELEHAYIVVLNLQSASAGHRDVISAFFGKPGDSVFPQSNEARCYRKTPSVLSYPTGEPRNTRVSGVLAVEYFTPWSRNESSACLYHNPMASKPYSGVLERFPQCLAENGRLTMTNGVPLGEILDLPSVGG